MDKIKFGDGFHLNTEALNFLQGAYIDGAEQLASNDDAQSYIISGVEPQSDGSITSGVIVLNGEVMPFIAASANTGYVAMAGDQDSEAGTNKYKNEVSYPAYYHHKAVCVASDEGGIEIASLPRLQRVWRPNATEWSTDFGNDTDVSTIDGNFGTTKYITRPVDDSTAQWRIDDNGCLLIKAAIHKVGDWQNTTIAKFVAIPRAIKLSAMAVTNSDYAYQVFVTIDTNGNMYLDKADWHTPANIAGVTSILFPMTTIKLY